MVAAKKIVTVTFVALAFTATASANMTAVSSLAAAPVSSPALGRPDLQQPDVLDLSVDWSSAAGFDCLPAACLPEAKTETGEAPQAKASQVLADHQSSLTLCLYVLMGVGLCKTVPSVRKLSLGCIPDWYHDGGPFQVGHSHAIAPDLCLPSLVCFIQPDSPAEDFLPNYDRGMIASLVRESLFPSNLLASPGPPVHCS